MSITVLSKHNDHTVTVHLCKPQNKHYAALRCVNCNVHIQWLSRQDAEQIQEVNDVLYS
jgi:hypothetical protein